jgi:hypothetical protein
MKKIRATQNDTAPATKSDILALRSDILSLKDTMALKSDLVTLKNDILETTKANTQKIVDSAIGELTIIVSNSFTRIEKSMGDKFEGVNNRIQGLWNAFDSHTLDCVKRDEHDRLEKRVRVLEIA